MHALQKQPYLALLKKTEETARQAQKNNGVIPVTRNFSAFLLRTTRKEPKRSWCNLYPQIVSILLLEERAGGRGVFQKEHKAIFTLAPRSRDVGVSLRKISTDRARYSS